MNETVILRTVCGCVRLMAVRAGIYEWKVPIRPLWVGLGEPPPKTDERLFKYRGEVMTVLGAVLKVYEEVR